jgi:hypothetical protein
MVMTLSSVQDDARKMSQALALSVHYAKLLDDHEAVRDLVVIQRRLEKHFGILLWNFEIMEREDGK